MERSKIIVLCLAVSLIALTINLGMFDAITPKEKMVYKLQTQISQAI
ncbi:MAG: hypothetical protein ACE5OZ_07760 [Candidatus Heimdallarchaeota archaeon]